MSQSSHNDDMDEEIEWITIVRAMIEDLGYVVSERLISLVELHLYQCEACMIKLWGYPDLIANRLWLLINQTRLDEGYPDYIVDEQCNHIAEGRHRQNNCRWMACPMRDFFSGNFDLQVRCFGPSSENQCVDQPQHRSQPGINPWKCEEHPDPALRAYHDRAVRLAIEEFAHSSTYHSRESTDFDSYHPSDRLSTPIYVVGPGYVESRSLSPDYDADTLSTHHGRTTLAADSGQTAAAKCDVAVPSIEGDDGLAEQPSKGPTPAYSDTDDLGEQGLEELQYPRLTATPSATRELAVEPSAPRGKKRRRAKEVSFAHGTAFQEGHRRLRSPAAVIRKVRFELPTEYRSEHPRLCSPNPFAAYGTEELE